MALGDTTRHIILKQLTQNCSLSDIEYCLEIWLQTHEFSGAYFIGLMPQLAYNRKSFFQYNFHFSESLTKIDDTISVQLRQAIIRHEIVSIQTIMAQSNMVIIPIYCPHKCVGVFLLSQTRNRDITLIEQKHYAQDLSLIGQAIFDLNKSDYDHNIRLTDRQAEIISWVAQGKSNSEIAQILSISPHTIDNFMRRLFVKLQVNNRVMAAVKCTVLGLI